MSTDDARCSKTVHECEHAKIIIDLDSSDEIVVRVKIKNESSSGDDHSNVTPITARRGSRIPPDFTVTEDMKQWAREHTPDVDGWYELQEFKDYWTARTGRDATKRDWVATWRRWMRRAQEDIQDKKTRSTARQGRAAEATRRGIPEAWA